MYWRNNHTAADLVGRNIPQSLPATNLPSPGCVFLQTSCCLVGSSRELNPWVRKKIINLTCIDLLFYINVFISYSFKECAKKQHVDIQKGATILFMSLPLQLAEPRGHFTGHWHLVWRLDRDKDRDTLSTLWLAEP